MSKIILVVDDEPDVAKFLANLLHDNGYATLKAANAREALQMLEQGAPDLILLDLQMPKDTGTDLYRQIRRKSSLREIPVIVVSGIAGKNVALSPAVPVLGKPIDEARLLEEVRRAIGAPDSPLSCP